MRIVRLMLLRMGILSTVQVFYPEKSKGRSAYHITISRYNSAKTFLERIGFGGQKKQQKLRNTINNLKPHRSSCLSERIPWSRKLLDEICHTIGVSISQLGRLHKVHLEQVQHKHKTVNINTVKKLISFLESYVANTDKDKKIKEVQENLAKLRILLSTNLEFVPIKSIRKIYKREKVYDFEVQRTQSLVAEGFLVHNSSGHLYGPDIKKVMNLCAPKIIMPLHTQYPELFHKIAPKASKVVEPVYGQTYVV